MCWDLHSPCFENVERHTLSHFGVNAWPAPRYFHGLWNLHLLSFPMSMLCCIYSLYLCPLNGRLPGIKHPAEWSEMPHLLENPQRSYLLMVDAASDDCLFGLDVTARFIPQTLEKGAQLTDCENSNYHSQPPSRTKSIKGDRIDALNTSKGTWFCWEKSTNLPPKTKLFGRRHQNRSSLHTWKVRQEG